MSVQSGSARRPRRQLVYAKGTLVLAHNERLHPQEGLATVKQDFYSDQTFVDVRFEDTRQSARLTSRSRVRPISRPGDLPLSQLLGELPETIAPGPISEHGAELITEAIRRLRILAGPNPQ
jgi:hypothetical protein